MTKGNFKLRISLSSFRMCRSKKSSSSSSMPWSPSAAHNPNKSFGIISHPKLPPPPPPTPDHPLSKRSLWKVLSFGSSGSACGSYNLIRSTAHVSSLCKCKMMKDCDSFHEKLCNSPASAPVPAYSSEDFLNLDQGESLIMWPIDHTLKTEKKISRQLNHEISYAVMKKSTDPHEDFKKSMMEMIVEKEIFEPEELEKLLMCFLSLNAQEHRAAIVEAFTQAVMEISWVILAFSLIAALLCLSNLTNYIRTRKQKLPPGPKPWPIIGNLNLLVGTNTIPHQSLHLLAKRYGELMYLKFGSKPVLVASSPEMAKEFLKTHDSNFASRPATASGKYTAYDYSDVTWSPYGPYWRQARRIYLTQVFSPKRLNSYENLRVQERMALISGLHALSGKPFVLRDHISRYSVSALSRMVFGNKYFTETKTKLDNGDEESIFTLEKLQGMLDEWFLLNGVFNIGDWIPFLSMFDLQGYVKQMKELYKNFEIFHNHVLDDHLTKRKSEKDVSPKDMVDILLQLAEDPNLEIQLTRDNVKALLQELLTGGTDTSATTIEWAMTELLKHPHLIQKATEELDRVIGRERWVEEDDYSKLPFLEAIIKETMRIHPLATLLAPHYAIDDCNVAGYNVSKGTTVLINVWSIGRDPRYWDSPEEFLPERFLENDIDTEGQNFALIPFGSGRRRCPGYKLGLKVVRSVLANLLHGFNWKLLPGVKPKDISMEELYGLTTRPRNSLSMMAEPRLPLHLY